MKTHHTIYGTETPMPIGAEGDTCLVIAMGCRFPYRFQCGAWVFGPEFQSR